MGALVLGLPAWLHRRRTGNTPSASGVWGSGLASPGLPPLGYSDRDEPPSIHVSRKLRNKVLDGFYMDLFALVRPEDETGNTGSKGKKGSRSATVERSFQNWLKGYTVYMSMVSAAYPERGWHLANHLGNILKVHSLVGEAPAMQYDAKFRKLASHNEMARWDLLHEKIWVVKVGPYARQHSDNDKRRAYPRRDAS